MIKNMITNTYNIYLNLCFSADNINLRDFFFSYNLIASVNAVSEFQASNAIKTRRDMGNLELIMRKKITIIGLFKQVIMIWYKSSIKERLFDKAQRLQQCQ